MEAEGELFPSRKGELAPCPWYRTHMEDETGNVSWGQITDGLACLTMNSFFQQIESLLRAIFFVKMDTAPFPLTVRSLTRSSDAEGKCFNPSQNLGYQVWGPKLCVTS
jgi:hypothetical protein